MEMVQFSLLHCMHMSRKEIKGTNPSAKPAWLTQTVQDSNAESTHNELYLYKHRCQ